MQHTVFVTLKITSFLIFKILLFFLLECGCGKKKLILVVLFSLFVSTTAYAKIHAYAGFGIKLCFSRDGTSRFRRLGNRKICLPIICYQQALSPLKVCLWSSRIGSLQIMQAWSQVLAIIGTLGSALV